MVEVSLLRYALRARAAGGSALVADLEFRTLLRRRDALLAQLRRRGVDLGGDQVEAGVESGEPDALPSTGAGHRPSQDQSAAADLVARVANLKRGMATRAVIGQAQGILIERHRVTPDAAFRMLVQASNNANRKLRDIAADLVHTGELQAMARTATAN